MSESDKRPPVEFFTTNVDVDNIDDEYDPDDDSLCECGCPKRDHNSIHIDAEGFQKGDWSCKKCPCKDFQYKD
jgi:hypothetical protein